MRTGPRPLSAHIGLVASGASGRADMPQVMHDMLQGIRAYQLYPCTAKRPLLYTQWQKGSVTVKSARENPTYSEGRPVLLLIPSMINRADILDLTQKRSMTRWLNRRGIETFLLDWGEPLKDKQITNLDDAVSKRIVAAIRFLAKKHAGPVHALGYCMGGTMLAGAATLAGQSLKSLTFLAVPWDFQAGPQALRSRVQFWAPAATPLIREKGYLPVDWMQMVFASLDPEKTAQKFRDFAAMDPQSEKAKIFVAVEDWLNDGVDLPAGVAQQALAEWFTQNLPGKGQWKLEGKVVRPEGINLPSLVIASKKDRLVEYETAISLHKKISGSKAINPGCGHIGMMAGKDAIEKVWKPVAQWVLRNN